MAKNVNEIVDKYTAGEITAEEANAQLKEAGAGFSFVPGQNELTEDEIKATTVGYSPAKANGYGLLESGTGSMEKVKVTNGKLDHAVNTVNADGSTNMLAYVHIGGKRYQVYGDELGEIAPKEIPWWVPYHTFAGAVAWPNELDKYIPEKEMMFERPKYHGVTVDKGPLTYVYAEDGTAKYRPKSMVDYTKDHGIY